MPITRLVVRALALSILLLAPFLAAAPAGAGEAGVLVPAPLASPAPEATVSGCEPQLDLDGGMCIADQETPALATTPAPEWMAPSAVSAGAARLGFCHCGCGVRCSTNADCGGAACRPFVTCC